MKKLGIQHARAALASGGTIFLFLRTDKIRSRLQSRRVAVREARSELDTLQEVVSTCFDEQVPVYVVPLALFWRKGPRAARRFLNVFYGAPERFRIVSMVNETDEGERSLVVDEPADLEELEALFGVHSSQR